ncbi:MAG TPA: ATP-binding protein [Thermoleophilaceae bacterium]|nr:ATP-binding protein [Thermoleophilaceae bacterium]
MRAPEIQTARLPDALSQAYDRPFHALSQRAPFPSSGGGAYGPRIEVQLDVGSSAASEARAAVGALDGRADADALDDVRLLLSEIVTNAVRHSGAPAGAKIAVAVSVTHGRVRAEVADGGRGFDPTPRQKPRLEAGGWGLHLVDRLADRWGVDRGADIRVWFEIDAG